MNRLYIDKIARCPVLIGNIDKLDNAINPHIMPMENFDLAKVEEMADEISNLDIYSTHFDQLAQKHNISPTQKSEVQNTLEAIAFSYLGLCRKNNLRLQVQMIVNHLSKIEKKSQELLALIEPERDNIKAVFNISSTINGESDCPANLVDRSIINIEDLQQLRARFLSTSIVEFTDYGKQAPQGYSGLEAWVKMMFIFWTKDLRRTLRNQHDGINGRSHLLSFMYDCREPLHPALEYKTLDNMLRKVQKQQAKADELLTRK